LNASTAHEAEAVSGEKSQFDVVADGKLIFSKQKEGRFPSTTRLFRRCRPPAAQAAGRRK
jgi:predicted Rdx family selenoprotein